MNIEVRKFAENDLEPVVDIFRSNIPKYFVPEEEADLRDFLSEFADDYYVLEIDGAIAGAGGIALNEDQTISLCWGMVRNDLIGKGLGKKLTLFRIEKGRQRWGNLPFFTSTSNHTEGFYLKLGFHSTERIANGFGQGIDTCKMRLEPVSSPAQQVQE